MRPEEFYPIIFTTFQVSWAFAWAAMHIKIRSRRRYADNKTQHDTNNRYKVISYFLHVAQNILCITAFWSNSYLLLQIHDSNSIRFVGIIITTSATVLYFMSLSHLGRNYSPCFDSHLPFELISSGPYKLSRHPMYLAKLMVAGGNFIISGSLWFLVMFVYLLLETIRTISNEEKYLAALTPGYADYKKRTARVIPFIF